MLTNPPINHWLPILQRLLPVTVILVDVLLAAGGILLLVVRLVEFRRLISLKSVLLELTPPAGGDKTPGATQKLFSALHGLDASRTPLERVLRRKVVLSLEVVSTKNKGIRYLLRVPEGEASNIERTKIHASLLTVRKMVRDLEERCGLPDPP
jgi:hypothetical protein